MGRSLKTLSPGNERNRFAEDLFSVITANRTTDNVIYSPASIETSLALLFSGSDGETANELRKVLYLGEANRKTVADNYRVFLKDNFNSLSQNEPILQMAQCIFVDEKIDIMKDFQKIAQNSFRTQVINIDLLQSDNAVSKINHWVKEQTNDKIQNLMPAGSINEDTSAILVNAIYFKAKWKEPFSEGNTQKMTFHLNNTEKIDVDMMYQDGQFNYAYIVKFRAYAIELPYENSSLSMLIIVPLENDGLEKLETKLKGVDLRYIISKMHKEDVDVYLPKFRIEMDMKLNDPLREMGLNNMFGSDADLSRIFDKSFPVRVSDIVHKAYLDVNEAGSEAAAATFYKVVLMSLNCNQKTFRADHPFLFYIRSGTDVFFAGHVTKF